MTTFLLLYFLLFAKAFQSALRQMPSCPLVYALYISGQFRKALGGLSLNCTTTTRLALVRLTLFVFIVHFPFRLRNRSL